MNFKCFPVDKIRMISHFFAIFWSVLVIPVLAKEISSNEVIVESGTEKVDFDYNPLSGLEGGNTETLSDLPELNRVKKTRQYDHMTYPYTADHQSDDRQTVGFPHLREILLEPIFREYVDEKILRQKREDTETEVDSFNPGFQFRTYGSDVGTGRAAPPFPQKKNSPKKKKNKDTISAAPPQIDENFVATLLKHPDAVKVVFDYLQKQDAFKTTTTKKPPATTRATTTTQRTTTTTPRPARTTRVPKTTTEDPDSEKIFRQTANRRISPSSAADQLNRLNSLFGLALLGGGPPRKRKEEKKTSSAESELFHRVETRPRIPTLSSIFGSPRRPQRQERPNVRPENVDNPVVTGDKKPNIEFFGPSDFVPNRQYSLPVHTNGPMKLKYVSASDFPFNTPFGIVPIPR